MITTTDGTTYADRDAYHLALRPLKSRGGRKIRISVRDYHPNSVCHYTEMAVRVYLDSYEGPSDTIWTTTRYEPESRNRIGTLGAYADIYPTVAQVQAMIDRLILADVIARSVAADLGGV